MTESSAESRLLSPVPPLQRPHSQPGLLPGPGSSSGAHLFPPRLVSQTKQQQMKRGRGGRLGTMGQTSNTLRCKPGLVKLNPTLFKSSSFHCSPSRLTRSCVLPCVTAACATTQGADPAENPLSKGHPGTAPHGDTNINANTWQPGAGPADVAVELHPWSSSSGRQETVFNLLV